MDCDVLPTDNQPPTGTSKYATTDQHSADSGTETGSHRTPSDSESLFDGGNSANKSPGKQPVRLSGIPPVPTTSLPGGAPFGIPPPPPFIPPPPPPPPPPLGADVTAISRKFGGQQKNKLRRFNWQKLTDAAVSDDPEKTTIWSSGAGGGDEGHVIKIDLKTIEDLFTVEEKPKRKSFRSSTVEDLRAEDGGADGASNKAALLDSKRSLNVNIFLRQFKRTTAVLAESIRSCDVSFMNSDRLRALKKLLPGKEEIKKLREFDGNPARLDAAEDFLIRVITIPFYVMRVDVMLLCEEFDHAMLQIEKSIDILLKAMQEIRSCVALPAILHLVLQAGNFLNRGVALGNATGFKLASLKALADTKANKPGITLMHYVAMELQNHDASLMTWVRDLASIEAASRISEEELALESKTYRERVTSVGRRIRDEADDELKENVGGFLDSAEERLGNLARTEEELRTASGELAVYLCERRDRFQLNDCFQIIAEFKLKFRKAAEENKSRDDAKRRKHERSKLAAESAPDAESDVTSPLTSERSQGGGLRRTYSMMTPHRRFRAAATPQHQDDIAVTSPSSAVTSPVTSQVDPMRRTSLVKPARAEMARLYHADLATNPEQPAELPQAWTEQPQPAGANSRLRVRSERRARSLRAGLTDDDGRPIGNRDRATSDDLESTMDRFLQRELLMERTQMRRSYMRLPRRTESDSDSDASRSSLSTRGDDVASRSDDVMTSRHQDIRERIRRYKESTKQDALLERKLTVDNFAVAGRRDWQDESRLRRRSSVDELPTTPTDDVSARPSRRGSIVVTPTLPAMIEHPDDETVFSPTTTSSSNAASSTASLTTVTSPTSSSSSMTSLPACAPEITSSPAAKTPPASASSPVPDASSAATMTSSSNTAPESRDSTPCVETTPRRRLAVVEKPFQETRVDDAQRATCGNAGAPPAGDNDEFRAPQADAVAAGENSEVAESDEKRNDDEESTASAETKQSSRADASPSKTAAVVGGMKSLVRKITHTRRKSAQAKQSYNVTPTTGKDEQKVKAQRSTPAKTTTAPSVEKTARGVKITAAPDVTSPARQKKDVTSPPRQGKNKSVVAPSPLVKTRPPSPAAVSKPASRSAGLITPSSGANRSARSRPNVSRPLAAQASKSPPASKPPSLGKSGAAAAKNVGSPRPASAGKVASTPGVTRRRAPDVVARLRARPASVHVATTMKETDLSDGKTSPPAAKGQEVDSAAPSRGGGGESGVQMNRAARLRMLQKSNQQQQARKSSSKIT